MRRRRAFLTASLLASCLVVVPFRDFGSDVVPTSRDLLTYFVPAKARLGAAIRAGEVPWLDPTRWGGTPLLALPGAAAFYPGNLLFVLLPPATATKGWILFHAALGAAGFVALSRRLGLGPFSAATAATIHGLAGTTASLAPFLTSSSTLSWAPWAAALTIDAVRRPSVRVSARLSAALALLFLTSNPETIVVSLLLCLVAATASRRRRLRRGPLIAAGSLAAAGILAAAIAAPALAAFVQSVPSSLRGPGGWRDADFAGLGALPPARLVEFLKGPPSGLERREDSPGTRYPYLPSLTPGAVGLGLALAGLAIGGPGRLGASMLVLVGAGMAPGPSSPVWRAALELIPPLSSTRYPEKWALLAGLGLAWLAALGLRWLERRMPSRAVLPTVLALAAVVVAERGGETRDILLLEPTSVVTRGPVLLAGLPPPAGGVPPTRVFHEGNTVGGASPPAADLAAAQRAVLASLFPAYGSLFDVGYVFEPDYDVSLPREASHWQAFMQSALPTGSPVAENVLRGAGVVSIVTNESIPGSGGGVPVLRPVRDPLSPWRFAAKAAADGDERRLVARFLASGGDPATGWLLQPGSGPRDLPVSPGRVLSVSDHPGGLALEVEVAGPDPGLLLLARLRQATRRGTCDGKPLQVEDSSFGLSAAFVSAGRHHLELGPPVAWLDWGAGISITGAVVVLAALGRDRSRRASAGKEGASG